MLSEKAKATIDAMSVEALRLEIELGRASRFQREKYAYLKVRLAQLERALKPEAIVPDVQAAEALSPKVPELLQNLKWLWIHGRRQWMWILFGVAALLVLGALTNVQLPYLAVREPGSPETLAPAAVDGSEHASTTYTANARFSYPEIAIPALLAG
jgi:hypothetical protein